MSNLRENQLNAKAARVALSKAEENLHKFRNHLRHKQNQLTKTLRQSEANSHDVEVLQREIQALETQVGEDNNTVSNNRTNLNRILGEFPELNQPWKLIEKLPDNLPFLLFPVRIETRFMTINDRKELWVRIFPDDIAAHTHEKTLTVDEINASQTYWREIWNASNKNDEEKEQIEKGAWRALSEAFGGTRAAWIVREETKPEPFNVEKAEDLKFPALDTELPKEDSWSNAPRSYIMPDRFVVMAYSDDKEIFRKTGNLIPAPLILSPDPQKAEDEYKQQDGELLIGEDIEWIYDFDKAIDVGMGLKIPLVKPFDTQGFDRLIVMGLRLSSDETENQTLLEELIENHRYAPDGMSILPQGTPTNNTDNKGSGFSSQDLGAEASYIIEKGEILFKPTDVTINKQDGQRLAEALGISYKPLDRIQNIAQRDVGEALEMNKSLWHGTLGYYLEEMLELDLTTVGLTREFFTDNVTGRGPLPAIRVGSQPYGILLTSDFSTWKWSRKIDGDRYPFLNRFYEVANKFEVKWRDLQSNVAHVGALGDPYQNLLSMMGLHASSVEHYRRHAFGKQYVWNLEVFKGGAFLGTEAMSTLEKQAEALLKELDLNIKPTPKLFELPFFGSQHKITDPLIDDISQEETEKLSEKKVLQSIYSTPDPDDENTKLQTNYIGWLVNSSFDDIKAQNFENLEGERLSTPRPLLYRMLRGALLQAYYDTTMQLYTTFELLEPIERREVELSNVKADRTVTRWEFMDADISKVMPILNQQEGLSIGKFLQTDEGLNRPEALSLLEVRECLKSMTSLSTARLERIFVEHLDLCSYRLDAWQMGCFYRRLNQQRFPIDNQDESEDSVQGIYIGAFGWLEDLHPSELIPVDSSSIPDSLHNSEQDSPLFEQKNNAGFIHGPSLNHAVAAAVLRNAYITHFDPNDPEKMAVNLSSERVRIALDFLEGIRNGQELGAMLGYQFERALHDLHGDPSLNQYIPSIRLKYPLVADKITEDEDGEQIETKEASNVFDGYALLEAAFLKVEPLSYPYDIKGLPLNENSNHAVAIITEVSRMADSLDAIKDLVLSEAVFQVTQGNFDKAGAMLKAFTEGNYPTEPEIVRTPQSGTSLIQRVTLHLETDDTVINIWPETASFRAKIEPNLNNLLGKLLPLPENIYYSIQLGDTEPSLQNLANLNLQPIDLVYLIGDDLSNEATELENRIAYLGRLSANDDSVSIKINFLGKLSDSSEPSDPNGVTLFELLPLLRQLRDLITGCRPLAADDFILPSETTSDKNVEVNPKGYDLDELKSRVEIIIVDFEQTVTALNIAILDQNIDTLRNNLSALAYFGIQDAFPHSAFGSTDEARATLVNQAEGIKENVVQQLTRANELIISGNDNTLTIEDRVAIYRKATQEIFGSVFNLIPVFNLHNQMEMQAATDFRDANSDSSLTRHHKNNPLIIEEWLQGIARVREKLSSLESVNIFTEALKKISLDLKPLQLPFREKDYWVAVSYPEVKSEDLDKPDVFVPDGDFLSLVQWLPRNSFNPQQSQSGLLIDEWTEVIPVRQQTTGIAVHYNQPTTEPPQAILLAVTPEITGSWSWNELVGTLHNTLDRAKLRAVEPDQLDTTALGHLLPAIISAVTTYPFATISTDFVHKTAEKASHVNADNQ